MLRNLVIRILLTIPTLLGVTLVTFLVMEAAPGDPAEIAMGPPRPGVDRVEMESRLRTFMGLDQPAHQRYLRWLQRAVTLDFGQSLHGGSVGEKLEAALPPTILLGFFSLTLGFLIAIPLGVFGAARAGSGADRTLSALLLALYSIPPWVTGLALVLIFKVWFDCSWLHYGGWRSPDWEDLSLGARILDLFRHGAMILVASLLPNLAHDTRFVRQAVLEELGQGYVMAARAKGFSERRVLWNHAFRGALVPILTLIGLSLPGLLAGSVILEQVFSWPGMGRLFFTALGDRDYPVILAITTLGAFLVVAGNLLADLLGIIADPRLRHG